MNRKAQGATEYLIILAVVIIVALIVVGVMGGIPGIGGGARARGTTSYWLTSDIAIPSIAVSSTKSDINVTLRNNLRNSISDLSIVIGGGSPLTCGQNSLASGQVTSCYGTKACAAPGDAYSYDVAVTYTDTATKASYTFTGEGQKLEGRCAT